MRFRCLIIALLMIGSLSANAQGLFNYYTGLFLPNSGKPERHDRLVIDVMHANWQELPPGINVKPYSHGVQIFRLFDIPFGKSGLGMAIGPGISAYNIHFNGGYNEIVDMNSNETFSRFVPFQPTYEYRKHKLSLNFVDLGFEFRFRTKGDRRFRFYPGFKGGWLFNIHIATVDTEGKYKGYNFSNLNRIRYGATLRIGWHRFMFTGYYALNGLFQENKGQDLRMWSAGMSLFLF